MTKPSNIKHVIIIGAGFAGLNALKEFSNKNIRVTIIDKNNYHTFFPLLYQVGAAEIEPEQIAYPVRSITRKYRNVNFIRSTVDTININEQAVYCNGQKILFDYLIIGTGSKTGYFNVPGAEQYCFPLKTLDHGIILRNHILTCFERAAFTDDPDYARRLLTFVIVGGGPTGVEFAGALAELVRGPLRKDFPGININDINILLVESSDTLLGAFNNKLSAYTMKTLSRKGVKVVLDRQVSEVTGKGAILSDGLTYESATVIWTAGVKGESIQSDIDLPYLNNSRIKTTPYLHIEGHDNIFITGDLSFFQEYDIALPMIAPVAAQQGRHAAKNILRHIKGKELLPFRYRDRGIMATIGRNAAVVKISRLELKGYIAWIIWLLVHVMYLIGFKNRLVVIINWIWNYIFFDKSVRLILPHCCEEPGAGMCMECGVGCQCKN